MLPIVFRKLGDNDTPKPGELWMVPSDPADRARRAVAELVLKKGVEALSQGTPPLQTIVVNAAGLQPGLDEMLASFFAQRLLDSGRLWSSFASMARYAALLRQGKRPTRLPHEETLEGIYLAIRNRAGDDLTRPAAGAGFLMDWQRLAGRLERAAAEGDDIFKDSLFARGSEFAEEQADLREDRRRYRRDVLHGEKWTVKLPRMEQTDTGPQPGTGETESGLLLRKPASFQFAYWSRHDRTTPGGEPYVFLAVFWGDGDWDISTDPAHHLSLEPLAHLLQKKENTAGGSAAPPSGTVAEPTTAPEVRQWYDGRDHRFSIISAPRGGTRLTPEQVLGVIQPWANTKKFKPPAPPSSRRTFLARTGALLVLNGPLLYFLFRRPKDAGVQVSAQVVPAVVRVETDKRGSGFLISPEGWVVTNYHVIRGGARRTAMALHAYVTLAQVSADRRVRPVEPPLNALVYKFDAKKDLALLKLLPPSPGTIKFPYLTLVDSTPGASIPQGLNCWAFGNLVMPEKDPFNLLRPGLVSQIEDPSTNEDVAIIHSSCNLGPGDSGGPLVDMSGRVIGVTVKIPPRGGLALHIHADDVRKFLDGYEQMTGEPPLFVPGMLPHHVTAELAWLISEGYHNTLKFSNLQEKDGVWRTIPTGLWLDLRRENAKLNQKDVEELDTAGTLDCCWKHEFACTWDPYPIAFYDTQGKGTIDLILAALDYPQDKPGKAYLEWRLENGQWAVRDASCDLLSENHFRNQELQGRFKQFLGRVETELRNEFTRRNAESRPARG